MKLERWAGKTVHVVYHSADLDGICSAAIVLEALRQMDGPDVHPAHRTAAVMLPMDYGKPFPWGDIEDGAAVVMADFSLPPEDMAKLAAHCHTTGDQKGGLLWYDHHQTAIDTVPASICGVRDTKRAACEIVAGELLGDIPLAVLLLGRYDVWDHAYCPNILEFQYGMRVWDLQPESPTWNQLLNERRQESFARSTIADRIRAGSDILKYVRQDRRRTVRSGAHLVEIRTGPTIHGDGRDGGVTLRALACNAAGGSELFREAPEDLLQQADLLLTYVWSGSKGAWLCGLYHKPGREDVDCGALAKSFAGGGGHKGAAGFRMFGDHPANGLTRR